MKFTFVDALRNALKKTSRQNGSAAARPGRPAPAIEPLECRDMMSVTALFPSSTVLQAPVRATAIIGTTNFPQPTAAGQALINSLSDSTIRAIASIDYNRDGQITRTDMIDILAKGSNQYTFLSSVEFRDLQTLANNGPTVGMPAYVQNLATKALDNGPAYALYVSGLLNYSPSNPAFAAYDTMAAASVGSGVQNWFLGQARPDPNLYDATGKVSTAARYVRVTGVPLFTSGGPDYEDVVQQQVGDCWLLASLAEVADRTPTVIRDMFIDNGDNTYTVRYFNNGKADYVTVDTYLPNGGGTYDRPAGSLWVALAEKAYAQECGSGWIGTNTPGTASYGALNGGDPRWALPAITGKSATDIAIISRVTFPGQGAITNANDVATAWGQGKYVVLCTYTPVSSLVVPSHAYALVGYANGQYNLFNPWGSFGNYANGQYYPGFYTGNAKDLAANFGYWSEASAAPGGAAVGTTTVLAALQTDGKSASVSRPESPLGCGRTAVSAFDARQGPTATQSATDDAPAASLGRGPRLTAVRPVDGLDSAFADFTAGPEVRGRFQV